MDLLTQIEAARAPLERIEDQTLRDHAPNFVTELMDALMCSARELRCCKVKSC